MRVLGCLSPPPLAAVGIARPTLCGSVNAVFQFARQVRSGAKAEIGRPATNQEHYEVRKGSQVCFLTPQESRRWVDSCASSDTHFRRTVSGDLQPAW